MVSTLEATIDVLGARAPARGFTVLIMVQVLSVAALCSFVVVVMLCRWGFQGLGANRL